MYCVQLEGVLFFMFVFPKKKGLGCFFFPSVWETKSRGSLPSFPHLCLFFFDTFRFVPDNRGRGGREEERPSQTREADGNCRAPLCMFPRMTMNAVCITSLVCDVFCVCVYK